MTKTPDWLRSSLSKSILTAHELVKQREGLVLKWYLDSLGKPTAGYGHLQRKGEEKLVVTKTLADAWFEEDIMEAEDAALRQSSELPFVTRDLIDVLVSVNYQLGTAWTSKFKTTWRLMKEGKFSEAATEAENSLWAKQTPIRVRDFQRALWRASALQELYKG